MKTDTEIPKF